MKSVGAGVRLHKRAAPACPPPGCGYITSRRPARVRSCAPASFHAFDHAPASRALPWEQDTGERLRAAEELVLEGRSYLAARAALRDMF